MSASTVRRTPRQERARVTVDAILEATAQLLTQDGIGALSTNKIAKRAGVSVGTLYQYFSSKEAILMALGERTLEAQFERFEEAVTALVAEEEDFDCAVRALLKGIMDNKRMQPELSRILLTAGAIGGEDWNQRWLKRQRQVVRSALYVYRDRVRPGDADVMTYVITTAFEHVIQDALLHHPELIRDGRLGDELAELAVRFLRPEPCSGEHA